MYRKIGNLQGEAICLQSLGDIALARSEYDEARKHFDDALLSYRKVGNVLEQANTLRALGDLAAARSLSDEARSRYTEALTLHGTVGDPSAIGLDHQHLALLARTIEERTLHADAARAAFTSIDRSDLVTQLEAELAAAQPAAVPA
jgi:tetratricopeptide (TPR) repeat protein